MIGVVVQTLEGVEFRGFDDLDVVEGAVEGGGLDGAFELFGAGAGVLRLLVEYRSLESRFGAGIALEPVGVNVCGCLWWGGALVRPELKWMVVWRKVGLA